MCADTHIAVVLVGFNSRDYLADCLSSLHRAEWRGYSRTVIYVDNASSDGSVAMVRQRWPAVRVIDNASNVGFSNACNQGVAASDSQYIYLLNVDTVVFSDSIWRLAKFLDETPAAAAAGNRLVNGDLTEQWSARRFPNWRNGIFGRRSWLGRRLPNCRPVRDYLYKDKLETGEPFAVDWIPGSCTLIRRKSYVQVGGLPEGLHYWSDAVFCDRIRKAGWEIFIVPAARLIHLEGDGTGGKSAKLRRWLIADFHKGAYHFYCEHYNLGPYHPARLMAKVGLGMRASLLVAMDTVRHARTN